MSLLLPAAGAQAPPKLQKAQPGAATARPGATSAAAVGIKNVGVGLGKMPSGDQLTFDIAPTGAVAGKLNRTRTPGSRVLFRDAANQPLGEAPVNSDGTFRLGLDPAAVSRIATACVQSPNAAAVCSEPGAAGKAITKAGNNGGL